MSLCLVFHEMAEGTIIRAFGHPNAAEIEWDGGEELASLKPDESVRYVKHTEKVQVRIKGDEWMELDLAKLRGEVLRFATEHTKDPFHYGV